ncbi:MAG: bifunctional UDP-N-acetylglucosamine diphosphorylase/glucosamine-1-phosphate N-acetyltransferase GlmU, partial [Pseudomonadota bacterium]
MSSLEIVILAAGQGKRMRSRRPKVLHAVGGRPMLAHVLATARTLSPRAMHVVYGHGGEQVRAAVSDPEINWVHQAEQHGTGHALAQALPSVASDARVLVLYGDVPLIRAATLKQLIAAAGDGLGVLTARLENPAGYGRIVRDPAGRVARIVEDKDATAAERAIDEINTGFLAAPAGRLKGWVAALRNHNAQGEYYLTDIIGMAAAEGQPIGSHTATEVAEILGVNSPQELARVERHFQKDRADEAMQQGVTLRDPARFDLRGSLRAGRDVVIDVNVVLEGKVDLGDGVVIGPNNIIRDAVIGHGTVIQPNCVIEEAVIGADCRIGPFARLRPGTRLADRVHIGNFVEVKNSQIAADSKANHLAYIGDATVGEKVNIGAGVITANYDG